MINTPFQMGWWGSDLPEVRSCDGTYCFYDYDSLPPLDESLFRGEFQWLRPMSDHVEGEMAPHRDEETYDKGIIAQLVKLKEAASKMGASLPQDFVRFMSHPEWQLKIPSCTASYFDLSMHLIPSPVEEGASIIRFYNDQQWVLLWYLYLTPDGSAYVLCSPIPFDEPEITVTLEEVHAHSVCCATSFESFLYRIWIENTIWFSEDEGRDLTPVEQAYIDHYKRPS